jgi:hypothetical protein
MSRACRAQGFASRLPRRPPFSPFAERERFPQPGACPAPAALAGGKPRAGLAPRPRAGKAGQPGEHLPRLNPARRGPRRGNRQAREGGGTCRKVQAAGDSLFSRGIPSSAGLVLSRLPQLTEAHAAAFRGCSRLFASVRGRFAAAGGSLPRAVGFPAAGGKSSRGFSKVRPFSAHTPELQAVPAALGPVAVRSARQGGFSGRRRPLRRAAPGSPSMRRPQARPPRRDDPARNPMMALPPKILRSLEAEKIQGLKA